LTKEIDECLLIRERERERERGESTQIKLEHHKLEQAKVRASQNLETVRPSFSTQNRQRKKINMEIQQHQHIKNKELHADACFILYKQRHSSAAKKTYL